MRLIGVILSALLVLSGCAGAQSHPSNGQPRATLHRQGNPKDMPATLTEKGSEPIEAIINTDAKTAIRLHVIAPDAPLVKGRECRVRIELHNTGGAIELVYMPALEMFPNSNRTTRPSALPTNSARPNSSAAVPRRTNRSIMSC
jgi:hypothetical protein